MSDIGYEGMSYHNILDERDKMHTLKHKNHKHKALKKARGELTGRSQKEQMKFKKQNRDYQKKFGRAWND